MSQMMSQSMGQHLRMEQRLTPQMIQSMAILQKPITDLEAFIESELESNAALERVEPQAGEGETTESSAGNGQEGPAASDAVDFARLDRWTRDFDPESSDIPPSKARRLARSGGHDAKMGAMANTAGREIGLHEHLLEQWLFADVEGEARRAGVAIIDHLDPDGYLRVQLEEVAENVRPPVSVEILKGTLPAVQKLEPAGIGARDMAECLLLQLDALPGDNELERTLVKNHLSDIAQNRLPAIADKTGCSIGEINAALSAMKSSICLHPGYLVGDRSVPVIRPDVIVEYAETGGGLTVRLTWGNAPALQIREEVAAMAKTKDNGRETRDFARKHVEEATTLIDAVKFRQSRMLDVSRAIVERQRDFFDVGPDGLQVLRMGDLAEQLGCDPSTISRTVAEKYMQTPRGIYPMRYFFTGGTETGAGETVVWDRVKTRVKELTENEDHTAPLNDDQIAKLLDEEGIQISRRTVAKYRRQLDIPHARQRRKY